MTAARIILQITLVWALGVFVALAFLEAGRRDCRLAGHNDCTHPDLNAVKAVAWPITVYLELDRVFRGEEAP